MALRAASFVKLLLFRDGLQRVLLVFFMIVGNEMNDLIPIIIPAYEPDERFIQLLQAMNEAQIGPVVVINDGSSEEYDCFFENAECNYNATVIKHEINRGKGRALKTAFSFCLENFQGIIGCVTADSDGQHTVSAIMKIKKELLEFPDTFVLGVRNFNEANVPTKSQFGNNLTRKIFRSLYKKDITDTQTGLRAIPKSFMKILLSVPGEHFEFETRMLISAVENEIPISEKTIETIYDSKDNHSTHFRPLVDSIRIYKVFGFDFGRFFLSSFFSSVIDLTLFQILCLLFKQWTEGIQYVVLATITARIASATTNYFANYYIVFKSKERHVKSVLKYILLATILMLSSASITAGLIALTHIETEVLIKIPVDVFLFFASYQVQKRLVY